jgi:regulator of chromosome condensation
MKRLRINGQLSKEQYDEAESKEASSDDLKLHEKASDDVICGRRVVKATINRASELKRHSYALNQNFFQGIKLQMAQNATGLWSENMKEYLSYSWEIDARYGDKHGVVLAFGSGDCGQLGHGVGEDSDMIVSTPRVITALEKHHVIRVACGGLHTVAVSKEGAVFTWGCNDDGALGRVGDENFPTQVTGFPENTSIINVLLYFGSSVSKVSPM